MGWVWWMGVGVDGVVEVDSMCGVDGVEVDGVGMVDGVGVVDGCVW